MENNGVISVISSLNHPTKATEHHISAPLPEMSQSDLPHPCERDPTLPDCDVTPLPLLHQYNICITPPSLRNNTDDIMTSITDPDLSQVTPCHPPLSGNSCRQASLQGRVKKRPQPDPTRHLSHTQSHTHLGYLQQQRDRKGRWLPSGKTHVMRGKAGRRRLYTRSQYPRGNRKPPYRYRGLIAMALWIAPQTSLSLRAIVESIARMFPFFSGEYRGWERSIRNCLLHTECFSKACNKLLSLLLFK